MLAGSALASAPAGAAMRRERVDSDVRFAEAIARGVEAFRMGRMDEAARAFQDAWAIHPADPEAASWLALVQDEQQRRSAITRSLDHQQTYPHPPPRAQQAIPEVTLPSRPPPLLDQPGALSAAQAPPAAGSSRREILSEGKRAGYQRLYREGIGYEIIKGLGVSARTEIYEEPNPVEDYVIESKILNFSSLANFRRSLTPLFNRAWATRIVSDFEPWPRLTYEFDDRDVEHEFETRFGFKNRHLETHSVNLLYTLPRAPLLGWITLNPWYKRVLQDSDQDIGTYENKDEVIFNLSLQPSDNIEYFLQFDGAQADKTRTLGGSKVKLYKGQVRMRFPSLRLFVIPSYEFSDTDYDPSDDEFSKRDVFVDWGFDIGKRWRVSSKEQFISAETSQPGKEPSNPDAEVFNTFNTLSYELLPDFDVSLGLDYSQAAGLNAFNNVGLRSEMELFKPGLLRVKFGYEWLSYYNINGDLSLLYWKLYLFQ